MLEEGTDDTTVEADVSVSADVLGVSLSWFAEIDASELERETKSRTLATDVDEVIDACGSDVTAVVAMLGVLPS
jgi:hypothetical protein